MPVASGAVLTVAEGADGAAGEVAAWSGDCVDAQLAMTSTAAVWVRVWPKVRKSLNLVPIMPSIPTSIRSRGRPVPDNLGQPLEERHEQHVAELAITRIVLGLLDLD